MLTPALMQEKLISASLYITAFELLKESIVGRIRDFYMVGFDVTGDIIDDTYEKKVLSRKKSPLYASLDWLLEHNVVGESDIQSFEHIKATRNLLAHKLPAMVIEGETFNHNEKFQEIVVLLRKIEVWWVVNVEITIDDTFSVQEIDESKIVPGPVLMIQMMLEVLSGDESLLEHYRKHKKK